MKFRFGQMKFRLVPLKHESMISSLQKSVKGMSEATAVPFMKPDGDEGH